MFLQLQLWWLLVVYKPPCLWRDPPGTKKSLNLLPSAKKARKMMPRLSLEYRVCPVIGSWRIPGKTLLFHNRLVQEGSIRWLTLFLVNITLTFDVHFPFILNGWSIQFFYSIREKMVVPNRKSARISTMCNLRGLPTVVKNIWSCPEQLQKKRCKRTLCAALKVYIDVAPSCPSCLSYPSYLFCLFCP